MMSVQWCRWAYVALILLQWVWFGWLYPSESLPKAFVVTVMSLPLLAPVWGVWRLNVRSLVIAGFVLLFYFSLAIAEMYATPEVRVPAGIQIALITIYFMALLTVRRKKPAA